MAMIRKQIYLGAAEDAKVKRLAKARGCTEAEVVREGIGLLPEVEPAWVLRLREAGLLVESDEPPVSDEEMAELDEAWEAIATEIGDINLSGAVIEDREGRDAFLAGHVGNGQAIHPRAEL